MAPSKRSLINDTMVWKPILRFALIVGCMLLSIPCCEVQANGDIPELHRKIADINLLRKQLGDRQRQAESAIEALRKQDNALIAEAHLLIGSFKISTFEDARKNLRLRYDMELLGSIAAYRQAFEEKIRLYQTGQDKLVYLQQMAQDDVKMVTALNDFQIDALATQISLVINQYLNEAHTIQIDPKAVEPLPSRLVWERLAIAKN